MDTVAQAVSAVQQPQREWHRRYQRTAAEEARSVTVKSVWLTEVVSEADGCVLLHAAVLLLELAHHLHCAALPVHCGVECSLSGLQRGGEHGHELVVGSDQLQGAARDIH